ncbi:AI-2E family transporter [Nonomuraea angiospora]|uniref:AI-2E family transporter n=1 Tax=Nonomuraea angiospora TaxID=46172 RepID=UPI00344FF06A
MEPWRLLGWIALAAVVGFCLYQVGTIVVAIVVGVFITALVLPPARWLRSHGLNRALATAIVYVGGLVLVGGLFALLVPPTIDSVEQLRVSFGKVLDSLYKLTHEFGIDPRKLVAQAKQYLSTQGRPIATGALAGVRTAGEIVVGAVVAFVLSVYFVHGGDRLFRWLVELAPPSARPHITETARLAFGVIGRYIRGVAIVGAVEGFLIGMTLWILGVPIALPLAVLTFVGAFLPIVGAFTAGLLSAVVALVAKGWIVMLIVVGVTVAIGQLEGHVLAPQIYGKALALPSAVILVAIAVGSLLWGIVGAFLAAPVTAVIVALLHRPRAEPAPVTLAPPRPPPATPTTT